MSVPRWEDLTAIAVGAALAVGVSKSIECIVRKESLEGKTVIVTGASRGLGLATASACSAKGARVIMVARSANELREASSKIARSTSFACDCANPNDVKNLLRTVTEEHGVPDVIINCAGAGEWKYAVDTDSVFAKGCMTAPYLSSVNVSTAFLPGMIKCRKGLVIDVNSPACIMPWPGCAGYAAARAALRSWNSSLRMELEGTGVRTCHVIFGKLNGTGYFSSNNVDESQSLPLVAKLIPSLDAAVAARALVRAAVSPSPEVFHPVMLYILSVLCRFFPGCVEWMVCKSMIRIPTSNTNDTRLKPKNWLKAFKVLLGPGVGLAVGVAVGTLVHRMS